MLLPCPSYELQVEGKITAGNLAIGPGDGGGQIGFGNNRSINAATGYLGIYDGDRLVVFNSSAVPVYVGGKRISVGEAGIEMSGLPHVRQADIPGSFPSALIRTAGGFLAEIKPKGQSDS